MQLRTLAVALGSSGSSGASWPFEYRTHILPPTRAVASEYLTPITVPFTPIGVRTMSFILNPNSAVSSSVAKMAGALLWAGAGR